MHLSDDAKRAREYLEDLCDRLDNGQPITRGYWESKCFPAFVGVAIGLSLGACESKEPEPFGALYGGPPKTSDEICDNGDDDNGDGKIDCDDPTCAKAPNCSK